jgi:hypothetical protein
MLLQVFKSYFTLFALKSEGIRNKVWINSCDIRSAELQAMSLHVRCIREARLHFCLFSSGWFNKENNF